MGGIRLLLVLGKVPQVYEEVVLGRGLKVLIFQNLPKNFNLVPSSSLQEDVSTVKRSNEEEVAFDLPIFIDILNFSFEFGDQSRANLVVRSQVDLSRSWQASPLRT
ncbi:uncharacterized protein G2W53_013915 [Senna tora]|uniref:Uncharacterized protein n=1 Tax=Senna tora TaxID=362788 RepID=A0A834U1C5_9FABA|nr:uncharacterized protein G2W53_013915 [Senna tora]